MATLKKSKHYHHENFRHVQY